MPTFVPPQRSYDVIRYIFVLFTFGKVDVIWFDTRVSDRSSLHVLHISQVSDQTFGLKLKVETLASA